MQRRIRTTKKLAQRIDLNYFKYPHPFRRWKTWLAIGLPVLATLWIVWMAAAGDKEIYSSGTVSSAHAVIGARCEVCHVAQAGIFREHTTDLACQSCHDGPFHSLKDAVSGKESILVSCGECHAEHKGSLQLAATDDRNCIRCHGDLSIRSATPTIHRAIRGLNEGHPEFAILREEKPDPGTIKLNHQTHLRAGLRGPKGQVKMECADCHRAPSVKEAWPFGELALRNVALARRKADPFDPVPHARYMAPVKYAEACDACHQLEFDKRIQETVPHGKLVELRDDPAKVYQFARDFMEAKFHEYLAKNPAAWREVDVPERRLPGRPLEMKPAARSPQEWVQQRMGDADTLLWNKTCKLCHALSTPAGSGIPQVARANMQVRWMPRSVFDHEAHRMMTCESCHAAPASKETADVLMPSIKDCQQCHRQGRAESRCFECHTYHDWTMKQRTRGKYDIQQLLRGAKPASAGASTGR